MKADFKTSLPVSCPFPAGGNANTAEEMAKTSGENAKAAVGNAKTTGGEAEIYLQFYELLRIGLRLRLHARESLFASGRTDWPALYRLAVQQGVPGVAWDGVRMLPEALRPPRDLYRQWAGMALRMECDNRRMNKRLAEVHEVMTERLRMPYALLKGQGTAQAYPVPERRLCGDIDLYVGRKAMRHLAPSLLHHGFVPGRRSAKHTGYNYKGVEVEFHRMAALFFDPCRARRLRRLVDEWFPLGRAGAALAADEAKCGRSIPVPPDWFEAAFAVVHFRNHLSLEGVGMRHLCDWYVLRHRPGFSEEAYGRAVRYLRMGRIEAAMSELSARIFEDAGGALSVDACLLEEAMRAEGDMGHYAADAHDHSFASSGGFFRVLFRLWRHDVRRSIRFFRFASLESVLTPFFRAAGYIRRLGR